MKSLLIRRVLFALVVTGSTAATMAACGDKPAPLKEVAAQPEIHRAVPSQVAVPSAPVVTPAVVAPLPVPESYDDAMMLGLQAVKKKDTVLARAMFDAASRLDATKAEPQLELARVFLATGEKKLALGSAKKAVKLAPESSSAWNTLGRAHLARFSYDDAITAFEKAVDKNPKNAYAWNNLGFTMLELQLWSEARNALEEATALPDATGYMFNNLGLAYEHLEMLDEAKVAFAAGSDLGSADAQYNRGRVEAGTAIAQVDVVITDAKLVQEPAIVEETGQIEEAAIVEEAVNAEVDAEAAALTQALEAEAAAEDDEVIEDDADEHVEIEPGVTGELGDASTAEPAAVVPVLE